jgi:hypothetical protein
MTQQYGLTDDTVKDSLPLGWIQMWDNLGKRHYFFNTFDHDIQYNVNIVMEKGALAAADTNTETEEFDGQPYPP